MIRKSKFIDENTQSQEIFIRISNNSRQQLMAGEYLVATFPVRPIENVMEIPRNSVFNSNEVFQVREGRLVKQEINVIKINERTLIFNGLQEGDTVVVQQLINVSEGTLVQVDKRSAKQGQMRPGNQGKQPEDSEEMKNENPDAGDKKSKRKPAERS